MEWIREFPTRLGLKICKLGWHREPYEKEDRPAEMTPEEYSLHPLHKCTRCGLTGRIDGQGNLAPPDY